MKKISEKDLSLDKQVVSNLSGNSSTKDETDGICNVSEITYCDCVSEYPNCPTQDCTDSQFDICCAETYKNCPPILTKQDTCMCPATEDSCDTCAVSIEPGCITPIPETQHC